MENNDEKKPGTSFLPMLLVFGAVFFAMQYFFTPDEEPVQNQQTQEPGPRQEQESETNASFLQFPRIAQAEEVSLDTGNLLLFLTEQGARITRAYVKSHDDLVLPQTVIEETGDPIGSEHDALEVTRGNGMSFQPHLYYSEIAPEQLSTPPLDEAAYRLVRQESDEERGVYDYEYLLPRVTFKGKAVEIQKLYRFFRGENYFRQTTVIRNLGRTKFAFEGRDAGGTFFGDLYYKPFGDMGPVMKNLANLDPRTRASYGRFFYYNGELTHRSNDRTASSGGCGFPFGCVGSADDGPGAYTNNFVGVPGGLEFVGSTSRYFFMYSEFLGPEEDRPDGVAYYNPEDMTGRRAFTAVFKDPALQPSQGGRLELGRIEDLFDEAGNPVGIESSHAAYMQRLQKDRRDAWIIDSRVYVGIRSAEAHAFENAELMEAEFGTSDTNQEAVSVIYPTTFHAFFSSIQDGIVWLMRQLHKVVPNYGWCIIIIAVAWKLITFPLQQVQVKTMRRMQALKPEMEKLNQQYADDPQKKQQKLMAMYKEHKINPMMGCLPMLLQLPVFMALYTAFSEAIELWNSPFILWMTDLSRPDTVWTIPFFGGIALNLLPLLMVVTQLLQQKFQTMTVDPQQKMMMYVMPVMFLFFLWSLPSGVTLYWTVQNLISIIWQVAANHLGKDETPATAT